MYKLGRGEVIVEKLKRLTEMTTSGGWAAKIGPEVLASVLSQLPKNENNNNLLVGLDTADDAAVYKLNDETALIQTLDFFTPMIDDPYIFGQIAAANSLSDVYAMGGKPIVAMNIVCFPSCHDMNILAEILKGGFDKVKESGALLVGGHTVDDKEPKYGLSISGIVHPEKVLSNATARVGDKLILTKPIGVGILNTAMKENLVSKEISDKVIEVMVHLNKYAAKSFDYIKVNSVTDITGFGLLGHALEMAKASNVSIEINEGEFVAIIGTSGSGKSTLLNMLGGLDKPTSGETIICNKTISRLNDEEMTIFRRRNIGFVFQNYNLVPVLNVYENIVLPIELDGSKIDTNYVDSIINTLGLNDKLTNMPNNLSGGQQQRVAIARALATKPAIILADEPTGNLDSKTSMDVIGLLKVTSKKFNQTMVMITHNEEIAQLADRIIRIEDGKVVLRGEE